MAALPANRHLLRLRESNVPVQDLVIAIEHSRRQLLELLASLEQDSVRQPIAEGRWSPLQYLEHLVRAEEATLWRMFKAVEDARSEGWRLESPTPEASIEEIVAATWKEQEEAPPLAVPQLGGSPAYWAERMRRNEALVRAFAEFVDDAELDSLAYPHPISGLFTMRQGLEFVRFHLDRHRFHVAEARAHSDGSEDAEGRSLNTGPSLEKTIYIDAPPEVVFPFLTDPEKLARWCGEQAELEPQPGGLFRVRFEGGVVSEGRYLIVDPPRRVVFTVGMTGSAVPVGGSRVEIQLTPEGEGTRLKLRHDGFDPSQPVSEGWDHHLNRLRRAARGESPGPDRFVADATWSGN